MIRIILSFLMLMSIQSHADWYFRGSANGWLANQLEQLSPTEYQTCQSFSNGDATGGPRFKIDRFGDWNEAFPAGDYGVSAHQAYKITFFSDSKSISVDPVSDCGGEPGGFSSNLPSLNFRGTPNNWMATPLTLVANNTWQSVIRFDGGSDQSFKLDVHGDWLQNYGDNNSDGTLDLAGADIYTTAVGDYLLEVNDQAFSYGLSLVNGGNQPPIAAINPAQNQTISIGTDLIFDGAGSDDADGSVDTYSWSTGDTSPSIEVTFGSVGEHIVTLTVTDNDGATGQASVTVNVVDTADTWFFRGTPNNWAATEMVSSDNTIFCTQQNFVSGNTRFKVDHFANWDESYPAQDYVVDPNTTYDICFNADDKSIDVQRVTGNDTQAPSVSADPSGGFYEAAQVVHLSVTDNEDTSPVLYYTTDGSSPHTGSNVYTDEVIAVNDLGQGVDLIIRTLAVDTSGNQQEQSFSYYIGEQQNGSIDFREETIYFVLTARFYDGDSSNNYYNRDRIKVGDPQWRGDFKGLIQQLDYIKDLGFTAIWITPPVENRSGLDYHGYHAYDFYTVDPRLESPDASYQDLIDAAHAKGLKIVQDVVINHSGQYGLRDQVWIDHLPIKYYVPAGAEQGEMSNDPYFGNLGDYQATFRDDNDNAVAPQWFRDRHTSDPEGIIPLVDPKTGVTVPLAGYDPNRFFGIDAQTLDPAWYHLDGFMAGGDWENPQALQNKHLAGDTIDLATENQNVKDYINGAMHMYLDMGVDAIRLDTVKHIERDELLEYINNWKAHNPDVFVFGENLVKGTGFGSELNNDNASAVIRPWWYTRTTQDPSNPNAGGDSGFSVLDFSIFSTFRDNVTRGHFGGIGGVLGWDWVYGDATKLVTFFQNHDVGPDNDFKYRYGGEEANAAIVYNLLWTNRGIPTLYYGEEIMFQAGLPQDIASANDTIDQTGRAYFGPHLDDPATQNHSLYQHIKRLNQIRKAIPALQKAPTTQVNEWGAGISFVRDYSQGGSYAVVGLAAGGDQNITVNGVQNGTYTDVVTGNQIHVTTGGMTFSVKARSAGIYVLNGPGKIGSDGVYLR